MELNEKQVEILHVTEQIMARNGFDGTSVRDIANEANVNVAMINYYFGSKANLLETLIEWRLADFEIHTSEIYADEDPVLRLEKLVEIYIKSMNGLRLMHKIAAVETTIKKRLLTSESFQRLKTHNLNVVKEVISYGENRHVFQKNISPVLVQSLIMGTFMNFQMNQNFLQKQLSIDDNEAYIEYVNTVLVEFLTKTLKALLIINEN